MTTKFEVGKTYSTRSICDHSCIYRFTIISRTEKTVTIEVDGKPAKRGVSLYDDVEYFMPFGRYSMAPSIRANREGANG